MCCATVLIQRRFLAGKTYFTITGKDYRPRLVDLGRWRWVTFGLCMTYFFVAVVLPVSQLVLSSFFTIFGLYDLKMLTLDNYRHAFSDLMFWQRSMDSSIRSAHGSFTKPAAS